MGNSLKKKQCSNEFEHQMWSLHKSVIGIDEAGRGPLAGPLVVAGVILPENYENAEIYDSKALSEKKREELFLLIKEVAVSYAIEIVEPEIIDQKNIYAATKDTMSLIGDELPGDIVLTDAMPLPHHNKEVISIIKGDQKSISIAAGSILAKVTRDHIMMEYDKQYPQYGFAAHKGYPTKAHLEALEKYGVTPIHRKSYGPVARLCQMKLDI